MGIHENAGERATDRHDSDQSTGFEHVKHVLADTLHRAAEGLSEKAAARDTESGIVQQASEWMDHSAEYVRQFDYTQKDAEAREYIRQNPGRSLLMAGGVGLIIGALVRRR
jgi:ElaB/YqjD/DUF883 family membrane-anchored ribosome-binding protein